MPLEYEKITETHCKFRGSALKAARKAAKMSRYKMAVVVCTYPQQIQHWEEKKSVKIDEFTMRRILTALGQESDVPASL